MSIAPLKMPEISPAFSDQIKNQYGQAGYEAFSRGWHVTDNLGIEDPKDVVTYLRIGNFATDAAETESQRDVFVVPGFTEGIIGKAAFALELGRQGFNVLIPDQNRNVVKKNPATNKKDATWTEANDYMKVIESEGLTHVSLDVIPHSYGSLVFEAMVKIAKERGYTCFEGSRVAMLAPAGLKGMHRGTNTATSEDEPSIGKRFASKLPGLVPDRVKSAFSKKDVAGGEHWLPFGKRFVAYMASEQRSFKAFEDPEKDMFKATVKSLRSNMRRAVREVWELKHRHVDFKALESGGVGQINVLGFGQDRLFPNDAIAPGVIDGWTAVLDEGEAYPVTKHISYAVPILHPALVESDMSKAKNKYVNGATHNDDSFNPRRIVNAVKQLWAPDYGFTDDMIVPKKENTPS